MRTYELERRPWATVTVEPHFIDEEGRPIVIVNNATFPHRVVWSFIGFVVGLLVGC